MKTMVVKRTEGSKRNGKSGGGAHSLKEAAFTTHRTKEEFSVRTFCDSFRLGHKFEIIGLEEEIDRYGIRGVAREKGQTGSVPLWDVEVTPTSAPNFWPIREYVVWMANRA